MNGVCRSAMALRDGLAVVCRRNRRWNSLHFDVVRRASSVLNLGVFLLQSKRGRLAQLVRAAGLQPAGRGFESLSAHQPGRCANRILWVVAPAYWNTEGRVDGVPAVHPDLVDQGLQ